MPGKEKSQLRSLNRGLGQDKKKWVTRDPVVQKDSSENKEDSDRLTCPMPS